MVDMELMKPTPQLFVIKSFDKQTTMHPAVA